MANLLSQNIGTNYKGILNLDATTINTPLDTTLRSVTDGMGTASPLQISTTRVGLLAINPVFLFNGTNAVGAARNWAFALNQSYNGAFEISYSSTNGGTALANVALTINNTGSVGIGFATSPVATALLQLNSTTKGFLLPRLTGAEATTLEAASPAQGLLIFVTSTNGTFTAIGWWGYNGTIWVQL
jgi:hypothetical protein